MWKLVLYLMLLICSYTDVKDRTIDIRLIIIALMTELFLKQFSLYGIIPAVALFIFKIIKKSIGSGDILIFAVLGIYVGLYEILQIMLIAFLLAGAYGVLILICKKENIEYRMPFVPFILIAFTVENIIVKLY